MKSLPTAADLRRGNPEALTKLLIAIKDLQSSTANVDDLVRLGLVRKNSLGQLFNPNTTDAAAFDTIDKTMPGAPAGLSATATANLAFLEWTVPDFQPELSHSEVWVLSAPAFREDIDYAIGDFVTYASTVYLFTSAHSAGIWDAGDVSAAGAGDLITDNAQDRYISPVSSAIIPLDVIGGTAYLWVRLVSAGKVAGDFSASTGVEAEAKNLPGDVPVGATVMAQAALGASWLEMNGQTVNRADYQELFSYADGAGIVQAEGGKAAGQYGDGDGSTTFSLPDYQGRVLVGKDSGTFATVGSVGGAETHTLSSGELPAHSHSVTDAGHSHGVTDAGHSHTVTDPGHSHAQQIDTDSGTSGSSGTMGSDNADDTSVGTTDSATTSLTVDSATTGVTVDSATTGITIQNTGSGSAHNNLQPYAVDRFWVRAKP